MLLTTRKGDNSFFTISLKNIFYFVFIYFLLSSCTKNQQVNQTNVKSVIDTSFHVQHGSLRFLVVSDWGRNGYFNQKEVADEMAKTAEIAEPQFIISCGDNFQINGVTSIQDPLWSTSFEYIYKHPSLLIDWYPVLGNHDYKGNTQAEIDYSQISRRWRMTAHYYSFAKRICDSTYARFIYLDTPPLINEYYKNKNEYPDIVKQDSAAEITWLKDILVHTKEKWIIILGHHPVFSASPKHGNTAELIQKLKPLFDKYQVDLYICGHDHDLQHLKPSGSYTDYIVTGAGSEVRETGQDKNTKISISKPGFTMVSVQKSNLKLYFIGTNGEILYQMEKCK